jgi:hypothetical protein
MRPRHPLAQYKRSVFPEQVGGCEKNWSLHRSKCLCAMNGEDLSQEGQSQHLIERADEYLAWVCRWRFSVPLPPCKIDTVLI